MRARIAGLVLIGLMALLASFAAEAQPAKVPRVGVLLSSAPSTTSTPVSFIVQGLRDLGYVEGQTIAFTYRHAEGSLDRLSALAAELAHLPVDLILADGVASALAAKQATATIPIVFALATDPVGRGLVASLARPGGNVTGVSFDEGPAIFGKRLELLKATVPTVSHVAMLMGQVRAPSYDALEKEWERAARRLGLTLRYFYVRRAEEFSERVFPAITSGVPAIDALHAGSPCRPVSTADRRVCPPAPPADDRSEQKPRGSGRSAFLWADLE